MATTTNTMGTSTLSQQQMNRRLYWGIAIALIVTLGIFYSIRAARERAAATNTTTAPMTEPANTAQPAPRTMDTPVNETGDVGARTPSNVNGVGAGAGAGSGTGTGGGNAEPATNP